MVYKSPKERMKVSFRRSEVEATGKPYFTKWEDVPDGLFTKTRAKQMGQPISENEDPAAYVLSRNWNGYLPLYDRRSKGGRSVGQSR